MSPRRRSKKRSGRNRQGQQPIEFWRSVPELGSVEPIRPSPDPTAVIRSLGTPPLTGQTAVADHYLAAAVERSAQMATALAAAAGLLGHESDD